MSNTDSSLSELLQSIAEDDRRYEHLRDVGLYHSDMEISRNRIRAAMEEDMFSIPATGMRGIAVKLRTLWPDLSERGGFYAAPDERTELHLHRLWALMQEADKLAEEEERRAGG